MTLLPCGYDLTLTMVKNGIDNDNLLGACLRLPEHVVHRSFVAETVVLNLQTGRYHGLNPVGGRMLDALNGASSVRRPPSSSPPSTARTGPASRRTWWRSAATCSSAASSRSRVTADRRR